jgi:hypothetical protein
VELTCRGPRLTSRRDEPGDACSTPPSLGSSNMSTTTDPRGNINEWNASDVCLFFSNLGFPQFEEAILGPPPNGSRTCNISDVVQRTT